MMALKMLVSTCCLRRITCNRSVTRVAVRLGAEGVAEECFTPLTHEQVEDRLKIKIYMYCTHMSALPF